MTLFFFELYLGIMGTRSLIRVQDEDGKTLVAMYGQWDGYIAGGLARI